MKNKLDSITSSTKCYKCGTVLSITDSLQKCCLEEIKATEQEYQDNIKQLEEQLPMSGWICYRKEDKQQLLDLGVKLEGDSKPFKEGGSLIQDCSISEEAMDNLDPFWGRFIWGKG